MANVTIYSTPSCVYCKMAKDYFTKNGVSYVEHNVASDLAARKEMKDKSNQLGVPVIDIDGKIIIGFDEATLAAELGIGR